jgi:hypothetical protein
MLVPFCLHALGAASCRAVDKNDRTGIDTDFILFEDRENPPAIPFEMRNDPRTVSTAWLKQCLVSSADMRWTGLIRVVNGRGATPTAEL